MNITNEQLLERLLRLHALMHRFQSTNFKQQGPFGNPYRGQGRILAILKMQPEISQKELGFLLDMRNQSLGELLSKLEAKGFIARTPSQEDRRTTIIRLTKEGEEAAYVSEVQHSGPEKIFDVLEEEERIQFQDYLDRLIDTIEEGLVEAGIDESIFVDRFGPDFFANFDGRPSTRKELQDMMKERKEMLHKQTSEMRNNMRNKRRGNNER